MTLTAGFVRAEAHERGLRTQLVHCSELGMVHALVTWGGRKPMNRSSEDEALHREIALRAYDKYCERRCAPGRELDDWLAAEREVLASRAASPATTTLRG